MKTIIVTVLTIALGLAVAGCGDDGGSPAAPKNKDVSTVTTFESGLEGWSTDVTSIDWGSAVWSSHNDGCVKLDGVGNSDPAPNAWMQKEVALPANVTELHYKASAHDRGDGTGFLRVRLKDGNGDFHTLVELEKFESGPEGHEFLPRSASLTAFAGQTVTLYFELEDEDGGGNNQVYVDEIDIRRSN